MHCILIKHTGKCNLSVIYVVLGFLRILGFLPIYSSSLSCLVPDSCLTPGICKNALFTQILTLAHPSRLCLSAYSLGSEPGLLLGLSISLIVHGLACCFALFAR